MTAIRKFLFWAYPVLHPIKSVRHLRACNASWPELSGTARSTA